MKKNSLLKAIGILFLVYVVLSWIIPTGYFSNGEFTSNSAIPVGIFDLILYPLITATSSVFILTALVFVMIGAFYGVLNKTKSYQRLLDNLKSKFKGKEKVVLIVTTIMFVVLASLTGLTLPLFVFVPLMATLLILLGYNKLTSMLSTVGAILVGNMASTYGFNVAGYIKYLTNDINNSILIRVILLVVSTLILIFFTLKTSKNNETDKEIALYSKTTKKVDTLPLVISLIVMFIITFVGMFNWNNVFGIELFDNMHEAITGVKIGGYAIFSNLLGNIPAVGSWTNYELCLVLLVFGFIIGKLYKLTFNEIVEGAIEGIKEILPVALMTMTANILFLLVNSNSEGYTFFSTIVNAAQGDKIAILPFGFISLIGSVLYNDFPYLLSSLYGAVVSFTDQYTLIGMIVQTIHGLVQLIVPTSVILVAGLTYFKIPYTKWLKENWKLFLSLFVLIVILLLFV